MFGRLQYSLVIYLVTYSFPVELVTGEGRFIVISNQPEVDADLEGLSIYAVSRDAFDESAKIVIGKDGGLPSDFLDTGPLPVRSALVGCYLQLTGPGREKSLRYGRYTAKFTFDDTVAFPTPQTVETFVKPRTKLLDTGGVYTVTIYPAVTDATTLAKPVSIGVRQAPGCQSIIWSKGRNRKFRTGPRLRLTDTRQAGLYTVFRQGRSKRSFVQIRVIAASCPRGQYWMAPSGPCTPGTIECKNGGVLADAEDRCICPLFYTGPDCGCVFPHASCPGGWSQFNNFCYLFVDDSMDYQESVDTCRLWDTQLASIHSEEENLFVKELVGGVNTWLGLNDLDEEGVHLYSDKTEFDFEDWGRNQPTPDSTLNDCIAIWGNSDQWYDRMCHYNYNPLCKEPVGGFPVESLSNLECGDLPGGDPQCDGSLACLGDNYGCKCTPGWWGNACNRPCPKGKYGAGCEERCPEDEPICDRFLGPRSNWESSCVPSP